ncbi:DNA polymerase III, beta subunit [Holzapfeliella floricola DSM 23037 = JCM 16512]|uniref:Beta sliding clamp n=2 Tax=Holzapfeliella TaxID=2767883 RepID=A0A0R2DLB4_9LACO|nr:DNA polymerase III, beta subunit [Holzapfeliella floricola DSM 23037 = JCM 16512]
MRAISSKTTIPILTGIKLELSTEGLILTGSNSDISIKSTVIKDTELQIQSEGNIVLPARFFSEIVKKLPESIFTFEVKENLQTVIKSGSSEFLINGLDADNYPRLPQVSKNLQFELNGKMLRNLINQTNFAVSTQESRPILTGVHFVISNNQVKAVATDSHRLSQRILQIENGPDNILDFIIPGKSLTELSRILSDVDDNIQIQMSENQILFTIGNLSFYSRLLEGTYPETDRLLPDSSTTDITFNSSKIFSALERASLLTHESRNNVVRLVINPELHQVVLYGNSPEVGNVEEILNVDTLVGESLEISFNPDYLKSALRAFKTDQITMKFTQPLRPFTVVPKENDGQFVQLITPVRTF